LSCGSYSRPKGQGFLWQTLTGRRLAGRCDHSVNVLRREAFDTFSPRPSLAFTFSERVEGVDHELEDAVPHETVVQGGRASASLEARLSLSRETKNAVSSQKGRASTSEIRHSSTLITDLSHTTMQANKVHLKCLRERLSHIFSYLVN
jgi:hypothetical protein